MKNLVNLKTIPLIALATLLFAFPAYASAAPSTVTFHDVTSSFVVPPATCPDGSVIPGGLVTVTANGVVHFNGLESTMTTTGTFTLTSTTNGIDYTGHLTTWNGGTSHLTNNGAEFGFTLSVHATGSDGSTIAFHEHAQFTANADGTVVVNTFTIKC